MSLTFTLIKNKIVVTTSLFFLSFFIIPSAIAQMRQVYVDANPFYFIKRASFCSDKEGYVLFQTQGLQYTADSGKSFVSKPIGMGIIDVNGYNIPAFNSFTIFGVTAFSSDTLFVYGNFNEGPAIIYSFDQGATYKVTYFNNADTSSIFSMVFPQDHTTGYAIDKDRILKTTDKGQNWTTVNLNYNNSLNYIEGADNNTVYAFSTGATTSKLLKTANSGTTWQQLTIPAGRVRYATFISANNGWLSMVNGTDSALYYTNNGGTNWVQKNNSFATPFASPKMRFINDSTGFALGDAFKTFKTTDSGKVWEPVQRNTNYTYANTTHNDLCIYNKTQLWAGGGHGFLEVNSNLSAYPLPKAFFAFDTTNVYFTGTVNLVNYSKPFYQYQWYLNNALISTNYNCNYTHNAARQIDTVKLIVTFGGISDTLSRIQYFLVPPVPVIKSFVPASGSIGTFVAIRGNHFLGVTRVRFGGTLASSFTVVNDSLITATVANGATGSVTLEYLYGLTSGLAGFTYFAPSTATPPNITAFSPQSGPAGTVVTITGSNFGATAADNIVFFGASKGAVLSASATQLMVQVPTGATHKAFTVLNTTTQLTAYSMKPFLVTFPGGGGAFTSTSFVDVLNFNTPSTSPSWIVTAGDFNNDGKPDIVTAPNYGLRLSVFKNASTISTASFILSGNYFTESTGVKVQRVDIADMDGDGKLDIVATRDSNFNSIGTISILRNTSSGGNISFDPPVNLIGGNAQQGIAIRDIDGDGKPELVIPYSQYVSPGINYTFSIYRNTSVAGFVSFAQRTDFGTTGAASVEIADMDNDNIADIIATRYYPNDSSFAVYKNLSTPGNFSFGPELLYKTAGKYPKFAFPYDMDNDDKADAVIEDTYENKITTYRNTGTTGNIALGNRKDFPLSLVNNGAMSAVGDLNGDGKLDVVSTPNLFIEILNNQSVPGIIALAAPMVVTTSQTNGGDVCLADFDGDGKLDIAQMAGTGNIHIFKNNFANALAYAGPDAGICIGGSIQLGTSPVAGNTYSWTSSPAGFTSASANPTVSPTVTTSYFLTVSNGTSTAKDTVVITVNPLPVANAGPDKAACALANTVIGTAATTGNTYSWTSNPAGFTSSSATPTVSPAVTTSYYLVVTNSAGCFSKDTVVVTVSSPVANAGPDKLICTASSTTIGVAVTGDTYFWTSSPAGFSSSISNPTVSPVVTTTYFLTVTNSAGCSAKDTVIVKIDTPVANAGADKTICSGSIVTIGTAALTGYTYSWSSSPVGFSSSNATPIVSPTATTTYFVAAFDGTCTGYDTVIVNVNSQVTPSVSITASATNICTGGSATFTATPVNGGTSPSYQWQVNGVNQAGNANIFSPSVIHNNDQVKVTLTSALACASPTTVVSNVITMTVTPTPNVNAGNDVTICNGSSTQLNATGGTSYSWSPSTGLSNPNIANPVASPSVTTAYIVTATNNGLCSAKDTVVVTVALPSPNPSVTISTTSNNICSATPATFTAVVTNGGSNPAYQWQVNAVNTGSNSNTFTSANFNNNDQVKLVLTSNAACQANNTAVSNIITMAVVQLDTPQVTVSNRVFTVTNPDINATYTWQINTNNTWTNVVPAANGTTYTATAAGSYRVMAVKGICTKYSLEQVTNFTGGTPANNAFGIFLYPNPVHDVVKLDSLKLSQNWETLEVINTDGKLVLPSKNIINQTSVLVNVSSLIKGTYFLQLRRKDGEFTTLKLLKL